jgi:drug/metabolite transporter (DMT)-like permease
MSDMEAPRRKTIIFILIVVLANSFGNLLLALGMDRMPSFAHVPLAHYLLALLTSPWVIPGAVLTAVYTLAQLSLFSWADLSYVIPCTAASYIVTTLLGEFVVGEHVEALRWVGVLLISAGVVLVAETPTRTVPRAESRTVPGAGLGSGPDSGRGSARPQAGEVPPC